MRSPACGIEEVFSLIILPVAVGVVLRAVHPVAIRHLPHEAAPLHEIHYPAVPSAHRAKGGLSNIQVIPPAVGPLAYLVPGGIAVGGVVEKHIEARPQAVQVVGGAGSMVLPVVARVITQ